MIAARAGCGPHRPDFAKARILRNIEVPGTGHDAWDLCVDAARRLWPLHVSFDKGKARAAGGLP
jgi:hypothetical protein